MPLYVCGFCKEKTRHRKGESSYRKFFSFPRQSKKKSVEENKIIEKRNRKWLELLGDRAKDLYGEVCVCSDHFHRGKIDLIHFFIIYCLRINFQMHIDCIAGEPAYFRLESDVDWLPSLNLGDTGSTVNNTQLEQAISMDVDDSIGTVTKFKPDTCSKSYCSQATSFYQTEVSHQESLTGVSSFINQAEEQLHLQSEESINSSISETSEAGLSFLYLTCDLYFFCKSWHRLWKYLNFINYRPDICFAMLHFCY